MVPLWPIGMRAGQSPSLLYTATSKTIFERVDRTFNEAPRQRRYCHCAPHCQAKLQQGWQKKKIDACAVKQNWKKKVNKRMVYVNSVTDLACIHERFRFENLACETYKSR